MNNRYRKQLGYVRIISLKFRETPLTLLCAQYRDGGGKRKVVEQRKLMKNYLEFIKSSQRYYRGYIQSLGSRFGGIPEIEAVAHRLAVHCKYPADDSTS